MLEDEMKHGEGAEGAGVPEAGEPQAFDPFEGEQDPTAMPDAAQLEAHRSELARQKAEALKDADGRTADLFERMHDDRKALLAVLRACTEPQTQEQAEQAAQRGAIGRHSVFGPATLCRLLEEAGALERIEEENPQDASGQAENGQMETVVVDGVEYLEPQKPLAFVLRTTDAGAKALAADRPLERLEGLFEEKGDYLPVFKRVLTMCAQPEGAATRAINAAVDNDPLVQKPRYYASYFTERLEGCDAICWRDGAWHIADDGVAALDMLADVDDEYGESLDQKGDVA